MLKTKNLIKEMTENGNASELELQDVCFAFVDSAETDLASNTDSVGVVDNFSVRSVILK